MFVKLTHTILKELQTQGYNVLSSVNTVGDDNPTYMPEKVYDVNVWLNELESTPLSEPAAIVIEDALKNILEIDLKGAVWINKDWKRSI